MTILDVDLDFFLSEIITFKSGSGRVPEDECSPWSEAETHRFLEEQCGLSLANPIPGKVVIEHDEVFKDWRQLIREGKLDCPFELVHVDAHADLGMGFDTGPVDVAARLLGHPIPDRPRNAIKLAASNFLLHALACRWISKLTYVHHPKLPPLGTPWGHDVPPDYVVRHADGTISLRLTYYGRDAAVRHDWEQLVPISIEPEIPFTLVPGPQYRADTPFSRMYLTQSPAYTTASSDALLAVIRQYIREEV